MSMQKFYKPKISKSGMFKIKGNEVVLDAKIIKKEYDRVSRTWRVTQTQHADIPVSELGFVKEVSGFVVFIREAMSPQSLKMYRGYFRQDVRIAIPKNRRKLKYSYLYVTPLSSSRSLNPLMIRHFAHNATTTLSMGDIEANEITFQKIGKPKRITEATKNRLMRKKDFLGLFRTEKLTQFLIEM
jgi:hypothetical protein